MGLWDNFRNIRRVLCARGRSFESIYIVSECLLNGVWITAFLYWRNRIIFSFLQFYMLQ